MVLLREGDMGYRYVFSSSSGRPGEGRADVKGSGQDRTDGIPAQDRGPLLFPLAGLSLPEPDFSKPHSQQYNGY